MTTHSEFTDVSTEELIQQAEAAQTTGDYVQAETIWRRIILRDRTHTEAQVGLGLALMRQGRLDEAVPVFQSALQYNPGDADSYYHFGHLMWQRGNIGRAIALFQLGSQFNPTDPLLHRSLGAILLEDGQREAALPALQQALELDPTDTEAATLLQQTQQEPTP